MRRLLPYPVIWACLLLLWVLLNESLSPGSLLLGALVALFACWGLALLRPPASRLRQPAVAMRLLGMVLADIFRSNIAVARIILSPQQHGRRSGFVSISLELRDSNGLAVLACILTAAPGTAWVDFDSAEGTLLLHILDLVDKESWIGIVKNRYERPLMEIFQ
jgi:multicomponent K+:H+ antiporter subunit E